jgi:CBS domain-containing protein
MLVRELMTTPVVTLRLGTSVGAAAGVLLDNRISAAPVVDASGHLLGLVTEIDLERGALASDPRGHLRATPGVLPPLPRTVDEVMSTDVLAVPPGLAVNDLVGMMQTEHVRSIPVVEGARVVGIVSRRDVLRLLVRSDHEVRSQVVEQVVGATGGHVVEVGVVAGVVSLRSCGDDELDVIAAVVASTVPGARRVVIQPTAEATA